MTGGGAEKSQQCHMYILQYSKFPSEKSQIRTWEYIWSILGKLRWSDSRVVTLWETSFWYSISTVTIVFALFVANCANATTRNSFSLNNLVIFWTRGFAPYNMKTLIIKFTNNYICFYSLFKVREAWNKGQLLKKDVVDKRLWTTVLRGPKISLCSICASDFASMFTSLF